LGTHALRTIATSIICARINRTSTTSISRNSRRSEWASSAIRLRSAHGFIPPFGASGNPVDITGGEPPKTYQNTVRLGLEDPRIHALILGYWHTIVTPPMVFAKLLAEIVEEMRGKGIDKPVVVSLAGDVEVEEAAEYLFDHEIPAYPYSTEIPVDVLGAKYRWARGAGLL
jgi:acyl-CoA synthetase (NDP forming)